VKGATPVAEALHIFDALPNYHGDKRSQARMARSIMSLVPPANLAPAFADVWHRSQAVALMAKAHGYRVEANAVGDLAYISGQALIANNKRTLGRHDVASLVMDLPETSSKRGFIEREHADLFLRRHAQYLDAAVEKVQGMENGAMRQAMLLHLLFKLVAALQPFKVSAVNVSIPVEDKRVEQVKTKQLPTAKVVLRSLTDTLGELAEQVNRGIIDNARKNVVDMRPDLDFLEQVKVDTAYFDVPALVAETAEEHLLLEIIRGERTPGRDRLHKDKLRIRLENALQAAEHIQTWILKLGPVEASELQEYAQLVAARRREPFSYRVLSSMAICKDSLPDERKLEGVLILGRARW
jgi:hypothetical protein